MSNNAPNTVADIARLDQDRERVIRALANNPVLHGHTGGIVEKITGETVTDTIVDCMIAGGASPAKIMETILTVNPHELAESVRNLLLESIYGSQNTNMFNDDGSLSDNKFLGEY
jgi:hypothetical protein